METVFVPFTLGETKDSPTVASVKFRIDRQQSQFSSIRVARVQFMKVYEQSKYGTHQYPFTDAWDQWKTYLNEQRAEISKGNTVRNDLFFGHARTPELIALDDLPCILELELATPSLGHDRVSVNTTEQLEYQTINSSKRIFKNDDNTIQTHMIYSTNLIHGNYGGWEGSITCNMTDVGFFDVRRMALGNEFEIKVRMYNFKRQQLSSIPGMQLNLFFR